MSNNFIQVPDHSCGFIAYKRRIADVIKTLTDLTDPSSIITANNGSEFAGKIIDD